MIAIILDHLWQSTLVLGAIGLLTLLFRGNGAHVRHALWTAASLKFLVPFAALNAFGVAVARLAGWTAVPLPLAETVFAAARPFADGRMLPAPQANLLLTGALWAAGAATLAALWFARWLKLRALLARARAAAIAAPMPVVIAPSGLEPGLVGIVRPVLVLPEGIMARLSDAELRAVIAHEACHMRRRDNLLAVLHMLVQAVFWFWPPVWWLGARLVAERERACDEAVLAAGNDPLAYAEGILKVCKFYVSSPLACAAGIAGANLSHRMETIMENRMVARVNGMKKTLLAGAAAALVLAPLAAGLLWSPAEAACTPEAVMSTHTIIPYPPESQKAKEQGTVDLRVAVAPDGRATAARVAKSSGHPRLDSAAAQWVRQTYRWQPNRCNAQALPLKVVFSLADAK